jgi:hypothetical protein
MNISPNEAEEALAEVQSMMEKTRHSIASSGAHISLIATGIVWMIGFICTQFLSGEILVYIWIGLSILGTAAGTVLGMRRGKQVRSSSTAATAKRIGIIWLLLAVYCLATIAVAWPLDGKQVTTFIVVFVLIGWLVMGLLLSITLGLAGLIIIVLVRPVTFCYPIFTTCGSVSWVVAG